jgi:ribonuclease PH
MRIDDRKPDQLRPVSFTPGFQRHPEGSVLACFGQTRVICSASVVEGVPRWMTNESRPGGWLTAEYQMLPGSTADRVTRELSRGYPSGRSSEIQRLVGRSLRAVVDLSKLPGKTLYVDCDVLDADGGTRCAAITGGSVAVELALRKLFQEGRLSEWPMRSRVAAVSVGIVGGEVLLDLCYAEDSGADVDMNVVMTSAGSFVEIQGTAEAAPFDDEQLNGMLGAARKGIHEICALQKETVANCPLSGHTAAD